MVIKGFDHLAAKERHLIKTSRRFGCCQHFLGIRKRCKESTGRDTKWERERETSPDIAGLTHSVRSWVCNYLPMNGPTYKGTGDTSLTQRQQKQQHLPHWLFTRELSPFWIEKMGPGVNSTGIPIHHDGSLYIYFSLLIFWSWSWSSSPSTKPFFFLYRLLLFRLHFLSFFLSSKKVEYSQCIAGRVTSVKSYLFPSFSLSPSAFDYYLFNSSLPFLVSNRNR